MLKRNGINKTLIKSFNKMDFYLSILLKTSIYIVFRNSSKK